MMTRSEALTTNYVISLVYLLSQDWILCSSLNEHERLGAGNANLVKSALEAILKDISAKCSLLLVTPESMVQRDLMMNEFHWLQQDNQYQ